MGTPPTGYVPKYKLWYIELNQFSHHSMWLSLPQPLQANLFLFQTLLFHCIVCKKLCLLACLKPKVALNMVENED